MKLYTLLALSITFVLSPALRGMQKSSPNGVQLLDAARDGYDHVVRQLISQQTDSNAQGVDGNTPLIWAVKRRHPRIVKRLIAAGVNLNLTDNSGNTALMWAVRNNQCQVAEALVQAGAHVNRQDNRGNTALIHAARAGYCSSIEILLSADADLNIQDNQGNTALMYAIIGKHHDSIDSFLNVIDTINLDIQNKAGETALTIAVVSDVLDVAKRLVEFGADCSLKDNSGNTTLGYVYQRRGPALAQRFFARQELAQRPKDPRLVEAARHGDLKLVQELIDAKVYLNFRDTYGYTPLIWAATHGHTAIAQLLIDAGADMDARTPLDDTALMQASRSGHTQIVIALIKAGADVNARSVDGATALHHIYGPNFAQTAQALIDGGIALDAQDHTGRTALMTAAASVEPLLVETLAAAGAHVDLTDDKGNTALLYGATLCYPAISGTLVAHGAAIDAQNHAGETALILASRECYTPLVKKLIALGADPRITDNTGKTAHMYAKINRRTESAQLLAQAEERWATVGTTKKRVASTAHPATATKRARNAAQEALEVIPSLAQSSNQASATLTPPIPVLTPTPAQKLQAAIEQIQARTQAPEDQRRILQRKIDILFITTALGKSAPFIAYLEQFTPERIAIMRKAFASKTNSTLIPRLKELAPPAQHIALYMLTRNAAGIHENTTRHFPAALLGYELTRRAQLPVSSQIEQADAVSVADLDTIAPHAEEYTQHLLGIAEDQFKLLADYSAVHAKTLTQAQLRFLCYELFALSAESGYGQQLFFEVLALGDQQLIADALEVLSDSCAKQTYKGLNGHETT